MLFDPEFDFWGESEIEEDPSFPLPHHEERLYSQSTSRVELLPGKDR